MEKQCLKRIIFVNGSLLLFVKYAKWTIKRPESLQKLQQNFANRIFLVTRIKI